MRIFEIILKLGFLAGAIWIGITLKFISLYFFIFLIISFTLGIVLIFNKKQSYGYQLEKREIVMRRIEGIILIIFVLVFVSTCLYIYFIKGPYWPGIGK